MTDHELNTESSFTDTLKKKVIITAALAGNVTMKENNPHLPYSVEEYVQEAIRCRDAGAAVLHLHIRDPATGYPSHDLEIMRPTYEAIKKAVPDVLINLTTSVSVQANTRERMAPLKEFKPDICTLNMNSMNFAKANYKKFRVDSDLLFENSFNTIKKISRVIRAEEIKAELEIFEDGGLNNVLFLANTDQLVHPLHFQFVFGVLGGVPFSMQNLVHFVSQIPPNATWSVCGVGNNQISAALAALPYGGHIRVGLEDNTRNHRNELSSGSYEQVAWAAKLIELAGKDVATPAEARQILQITRKA